ncbi:tetratricopeptide repeat protein [Streptomyces sp. NPDC001513]|uniref:tetratricopeptide repeat protein n=1 Tax=Streptomyces sp. NPDC001513 TaxID=3364580 RepID=UPI0036C83CB1
MPSHRDQDLSELDVEPVDTRFKKWLALGVALIALFGSVLGYAASHAGTREDESAREAQKNATLTMSQQSEALAEYYHYLGGFIAVTAVKQRKEIAEARAGLLAMPGEVDNVAHWEEAYTRLKDLSPARQKETGPKTSVSAWADASVKSTLAGLRQQASRQLAADWGNKSTAYIGGITLLAIALALLGLSATITPRARPLFCWPAAAIALVTLVGFVIVLTRPVTHASEAAMKNVVSGDRFLAAGDYQRAVDAYTSAIRSDGEYAAAYQRRAGARALLESPGSRYVTNVMSRKVREANVADLNRAMEFGDKSFVNLLNQGANYFHLQDYGKAEALSRQAISLNGNLPLPQVNVALALAGQGEAERAEKELRRATALFEKRSRPERMELYSSVRTVLETLGRKRRNLVNHLQGVLVASEGGSMVHARTPAEDAAVSHVDLGVRGSLIQVKMKYQSIPKNALVSRIFYFRKDRHSDWRERRDLATFEPFLGSSEGTFIWKPVEMQCPPGGEYRVDVYVNARRLASDEAVSRAELGNLASHYDPVGAYTLCLPSDWRLATNNAGRVEIVSPNGGQQLKIQVVPLPLPIERGEDTSTVVLARMAREFQREIVRREPRVRSKVGGRDGALVEYEMRGGRKAQVWASLREDGMLRTVVVEYRGQDDRLIEKLLGRIDFSPGDSS